MTLLKPPAHRFLAKLDGKLELRVLAVHGGQAYVFHCETPRKGPAWANVGSQCMIFGSTFHVAPPGANDSQPAGSPVPARASGR